MVTLGVDAMVELVNAKLPWHLRRRILVSLCLQNSGGILLASLRGDP